MASFLRSYCLRMIVKKNDFVPGKLQRSDLPWLQSEMMYDWQGLDPRVVVGRLFKSITFKFLRIGMWIYNKDL